MNPDAARTRSYPRGNYEEYHPYGSTAWWAGSSGLVSQKRYRFTGMERDEETGLQCHGVRYYATWLGRWVSADPIGLGAGINAFAYCDGSCVSMADTNGREPHGPGRASDTVEQYAKVWGHQNATAFLNKFLELRGPATRIERGDISTLGFVADRPGSTLENPKMRSLSAPLVQYARQLMSQDPGYAAAMDSMQREISSASKQHAVRAEDAATPPDWKSVNGVVFYADMKKLLFGPELNDARLFRALFGETDGEDDWTPERMLEVYRAKQDVSFELLDEAGRTFIVSVVEASETQRLASDGALATERLAAAKASPSPFAVGEVERANQWKGARSPQTWKAVLHEFHAHYQGYLQRRAGDPAEDHEITDGLEAQWVGTPKN